MYMQFLYKEVGRSHQVLVYSQMHAKLAKMDILS